MAEDKVEYVVVEKVGQLKAAQKQFDEQLKHLQDLVDGLKNRLERAEVANDVWDSYWQMLGSAALLVGPVVLAYILDYKGRQSCSSYHMNPFEPIVTMLLCMGVCIGIPVFGAAILEHYSLLDQHQREQGEQEPANEIEYESENAIEEIQSEEESQGDA